MISRRPVSKKSGRNGGDPNTLLGVDARPPHNQAPPTHRRKVNKQRPRGEEKRAQLYSVEPTAILAPTIISSILILPEFLTRSLERRPASVSMRKKRRTGVRGALAGFQLSPAEKALIALVLDDYGQQERWADALRISRDELIAVLEKILERRGAE